MNIKGQGQHRLKERIVRSLWSTVDQVDYVKSATLTGSFLVGDGLAGISDIDLIVIVDELNQLRFNRLKNTFESALAPILRAEGFRLLINSTLGPLKFNDDATAVLHLMIYSQAAHVDHVVLSPFTCFDWQRSTEFRKRSMAAIYPVFGLQPHHFVSARRSISDYLKDYRARVVSYRELVFDGDRDGYTELRREKPMSQRDQHEFAYHILRFLMQNVLKLVHRTNTIDDGELLLDKFLTVFPVDGEALRALYGTLAHQKKRRDFSEPLPALDERLETFVGNFDRQFRTIFFEQATCHVVFRHARTSLNRQGDEQVFLGRSDPSIETVVREQWEPLSQSISQLDVKRSYISPLIRCRESMELVQAGLGLQATPTSDDRLVEINYGDCEGLKVATAQGAHPELFDAWSRGEDPRFPGGESTDDVAQRLTSFADDRWTQAKGDTITCTHNVVLRCLLGIALAVPRSEWYRIHVPHLAAVKLIQTRDHGWFVDLDEDVEREIFKNFVGE